MSQKVLKSPKFMSTTERMRASLLANACESGTQRGLLLPWLFGGDEDMTQIPTQNSALLISADDEIDENLPLQPIKNAAERAAEITETYKKLKNIEKLYTWQEECLNCKTLIERRNLIIAMPTSAGKTLVAEILMLRELLIYDRAVMLILPYVSLVQEKVRGLIPVSLRFGFSVEEYAGGKGAFPPPVRRRRQSLYVATIEKASTLLNAFIDPSLHGAKKCSVREVGLVIVDEAHMIGDGERGATLEGTLIKLRARFPQAQIVLMSATVGNLIELGACFDADIFQKEYRPVPLHEYILCNKKLLRYFPKTREFAEAVPDHQSSIPLPGQIMHPDLKSLREDTRALIRRNDPDDVFSLVGDLVYEKKQTLVFCATRRSAESLCGLLAKIIMTITPSNPPEDVQNILNRRCELLKQMISDNENQCCPILQKTIPAGVAYHHAGLMPEERIAIEQAYSEGLITVLCCTSTLAAGVNLPARRVVIRAPYVAAAFLTADRYRQMAGRAGRAKLDTLGQSVIMCDQKDLTRVREMMEAPQPICISKLDLALPTLCLEMVCIGLVGSVKELTELVRKFSLYYHQNSNSSENYEKAHPTMSCEKQMMSIVTNLVEAGLIHVIAEEHCRDGEKSLRPTALGRATMAAGLSPTEANLLLSDLKQVQSKLILASPLHLLYIIIPPDNVPDMIDAVDFSILVREINRFQQQADIDALEALNLTENRITRKKGSGSSTVPLHAKDPKDPTKVTLDKSALPFARLQLAMALRCIWYGSSFWDAAARLGLNRGAVYQLMNTATSYAHAAHRFAAQMPDLWPLSDLMLSLNRRLVEVPLHDLTDLMDVPGVQYGRAKQLAKAGYSNLTALSTADPMMLSRQIEHLSFRVAANIIDAAKVALREKLRLLQESAQQIVNETMDAALDASLMSQQLPLSQLPIR